MTQNVAGTPHGKAMTKIPVVWMDTAMLTAPGNGTPFSQSLHPYSFMNLPPPLWGKVNVAEGCFRNK